MLGKADPENTPLRPWQALAADIARGLRFYSRLPVPRLSWEGEIHAVPEIDGLVRVIPVVGVLVGLLPALVLIVALLLGLEPWLSASLSVVSMTLATGVLHEDGLADLADGIGGATRERRLAIMKDSRLGSYGASALVLSFLLRIGALATLSARLDPASAGLAVIMASCLSRTASLAPLAFLPPARETGSSHAMGQPARERFWRACLLGAIITILLGWLGDLPGYGVSLMLLGTAMAGIFMVRLADRLLQGQTGDVAGAAQQAAEIAALVFLLIATPA